MSFKVGDQVIILEGKHQDVKATIVYTHILGSYVDVKVPDAAVEYATYHTSSLRPVDKTQYSFETYIRAYDNVEVEAVTGIPAKEYSKINLPNKIKESL